MRFTPFAVMSTVAALLVAALTLAACSGNAADHSSDAATQAASTSVSQSVSSPRRTARSTGPSGRSSGRSGAPSDPASSPHPVGTEVPADVPTTGPNLNHKGEKPPVMPLLATKHTSAGAVAFAKFFIKTIDWGFATTSGAYIRHYYAPSCIECANHANGIDNTRKAKEHYVGDRFTITSARRRSVGNHNGEQSAVVTFNLDSGVVLKNKDNGFVNGDVAHHHEQRRLWLDWEHGRWIVIDMRPPT
jgi:hypothetical protein